MSISINGAGSSNSQSVMSGTLTIKNTNDTKARMSNLRSGEKKAKRSLNYNHRDISGQLMRARKAQNASMVLTRAKSKLTSLQQCANSGQYDSGEVATAMAHAKRMVRCAQMKVQNLREEETEQSKHQKKSSSEFQQKRNEVKRRVAQKERDIKSKATIEEVQDVQKEKRLRQEMMRKRRMHRSQERGKINEADMKYIRELYENDHRGETQYSSYDGGVLVELSAAAELAAVELEAEAMVDSTVTEASVITISDTAAVADVTSTVDISI